MSGETHRTVTVYCDVVTLADASTGKSVTVHLEKFIEEVERTDHELVGCFCVVALADPQTAFRMLAEQEVEASLRHDGPVAEEVSRLLGEYVDRLRDLERLGQVPLDILQGLTRRWPIEAVAVRMMTDIVRRHAEPAS